MTKHKDPITGTASANKETGPESSAEKYPWAAQDGVAREPSGVNSRQSAQDQEQDQHHNDQHVSRAQSPRDHSSRDQSYTGFPASLFPLSARACAPTGRRGHWALAGGALAALVLAVVYLLKAAPAVTASIDLLIDVNTRRPAAIGAGTPGNGGNNNGVLGKNTAALPFLQRAEPADMTSNANIENQAHIITSALLLEKVFTAQNLAQDPDYIQPPQGWLNRATQSLGLDGLRLSSGRPAPNPVTSKVDKPQIVSAVQRQALRRFAESVDVKRLGQSYVLRLSVTASTKQKASRLATALAQAYLDFNRDRRAKAIAQANARRDQQLSKLRAALEQSENRLRQMRRAYLVGLANGSLIDESTIGRRSDAVSAAAAAVQSARQNHNLIKAAQRAQIRGRGRAYGAPPFLPAPLTTPYLRRLQDLYTTQLQRHAALSVRLLPAHPRVQYVRAQLHALTRQIRTELGRIAASTGRTLNTARIRARRLSANVKVSLDLLRKTQDMRARLVALRDDVAISRRAIGGFLNGATAAAPLPQLALFPGAIILTSASAAADASKPKLISFFIVVLIAGLVLVLAYSVLAEQFFTTTKTHGEARPQNEDELAASGDQNGASKGRYEDDDILPQRASSPSRSRSSGGPSYQPPKNQKPQNQNPANQSQLVNQRTNNDLSPLEPRYLTAVSALSAGSFAASDLAGADQSDAGSALNNKRDSTANSAKDENGKHTSTGGNNIPGRNNPPHDQLSDIIAALGIEEAAPVSLPARKFRKDITNLLAQLHRPQPDRSQIIVLQSPTNGDGHTALALALALIGAAQNLRVLLIDADYKSRHLSQTFAPSSTGRKPARSGTADDLHDLNAYLVQDEDSGVHFLPLSALSTAVSRRDTSTQAPANAASAVMGGITALAQTYDLTLIDGGTPPAPTGEASLTLMMRALVNLADQVLVCDTIKAKTNNKRDLRIAASAAPKPGPATGPDHGWQILSCKRVQGAPIVATIGEPA